MYLANNPAAQNGYRRVIGICFVLLLFCSSPLAAQVNIFTDETMRQMQLKPGWYNSVALDLTYRAGNTDLLTARTRFRSDYLSKNYQSFIFGSLQQGRKDDAFFYKQRHGTRSNYLAINGASPFRILRPKTVQRIYFAK